jgi:hypothetical protein
LARSKGASAVMGSMSERYTKMADFEERFGINRYIVKYYRAMARYWKREEK